jgi:predicted amidohydrolase YtcJ
VTFVSTTVFGNGSVLGADGRTTSAVAVSGGKIVALGDEALDLGPINVDLGGGSLIAAFRDGHVHPLWGGMDLNRLPLESADSVEEIVDRLKTYADTNPDLQWIVGGPYRMSVPPGGRGDAAWLDAAVPDRPVVLSANDYHTMWVNSRALELAGITADTPDPELGQIVRRPDGTPSGVLIEWDALALIQRCMPDPSAVDLDRGLRSGLGHLSNAGVLWAQEAAATAQDGRVYLEAARASPLPVRINIAWIAAPATWQHDRPAFQQLTSEIGSDPGVAAQLSANTIKFFADGVIEQGTGMMLEPYEDGSHSCGLPNWTPEALTEAVTAFDADGYQIHIHAIGDGGIRMALDAIEAATRTNTARNSDRRPVIAHTQVVHPEDHHRFQQLGVIANFEPLWACLDADQTEMMAPRLGPARTALQYPIASLHRTGAPISFGSDWPVTSVNPLEGLAVAVTRQTQDGNPAGGWIPDERLPILESLSAYTQGVARQAFDDDKRGSMAVGQLADFTLLEADITSMDGLDIADVAVRGTWLAGREVWRA